MKSGTPISDKLAIVAIPLIALTCIANNIASDAAQHGNTEKQAYYKSISNNLFETTMGLFLVTILAIPVRGAIQQCYKNYKEDKYGTTNNKERSNQSVSIFGKTNMATVDQGSGGKKLGANTGKTTLQTTLDQLC